MDVNRRLLIRLSLSGVAGIMLPKTELLARFFNFVM